MIWRWLAAIGVVVATNTNAQAERWISAEVPAAWPVSTEHASVFHPGAMPAVGYYNSVASMVALAVRLRIGALADGNAPQMGEVNPGPGGLTTASVGVRVSRGRSWVELAAGGGVTGEDRVPTFEAGIGWAVETRGGAIGVGPAVRYLRVVGNSDGAARGSADVLLAGLEIRFGRQRNVAAPPKPASRWYSERDDGSLVDVVPGCAADPECPEVAAAAPVAPFHIENDRVIVASNILFELNRARVSRNGRKVLADVLELVRKRGDVIALRVEGHTDSSGPAAYNQWLSEERASRVRDVILTLGLAADKVEAIGHGSSKPRDVGVTAKSHTRNRRVEIVLVAASAATP